MLFHLPQCRAIVRGILNQSSIAGFFSPDDIDLAINEAYQSRVMDLIMDDSGYFEQTFNIDLVSGQEAYPLPSLWSTQVQHVKATIVERALSDRYVPLDFHRRYTESSLISPAAVGDAYLPNYKFRGRKIVFEPTPADTISAAIRLTYSGMPPRLRSANAAGGGSTTITLDSGADPRDGYYAGVRVFIYSGTGAGQFRTITAYTGSTKVATVDSAWGTNPDSTSVFSILFHDDFPEIAHELICLDAGMFGFTKERAGAEQMGDFYTKRQAKLEKRFQDLFRNRTDQPQFVQQFHTELM